MKKLFFLLLFMSSTAFAVLPPLYTSIDQIKGMLEDPQLSKVIQAGELITQIQRSDYGFDIVTNKSLVRVKMTTKPQDKPGPSQFSFEFAPPIPLG